MKMTNMSMASYFQAMKKTPDPVLGVIDTGWETQ